jgi:23S rRNA pseudouridine1911/1915/1917 synthase
MKEFIIENDFINTRLDKAISQKNENYSRVAIQRMIEEGNILVNGKKAKASYKLQLNDKITIEEPEVKESKIEAEDIPLNIVYEDSDILVVNKQKGLVVHPRKW